LNEPAVVITGASTGIGRAAALHLDNLGLRVFAGVRKEQDADALRRVASSRLQPMHLDVTDSDSILDASRIVGDYVADSRLLGLVNNAGVAITGPTEFVPLQDWRRQLEVNLLGQIAVTQAFLPLLREAHGRVVFVSSIAGRFPQPFFGPYSASKAALESVADGLRVELIPWNIGVSLIEPGAIATPIWEKGSALAGEMLSRVSPRVGDLYGAALTQISQSSARSGENGSEPEKVASAIAHALTANRPRTRYLVGRDARMMAFIKRVLPDRARDAVILRALKLPRTAQEVSRRISLKPKSPV
jgi:NAD(P)-dependent dehydrogenase (short-subunit alcohol dehydrogenase family)